MPHANIWIRKQDWDKWEQIPNKSEFISGALNGAVSSYEMADEIADSRAHDLGRAMDQASPGQIFNGLTCKAGHPSKDGKSCMNLKCAYFN